MAAALLCAGLQQANAAILANYTFNSRNGTSSDTDATSTAGTFSAVGITSSYNNPNFVTGDTIAIRAATSTMPTALNTADYYHFTIAPTTGNRLNLSGTSALTIQYARSSATAWTFSWAVRSSLDNYGADIASGSVTTASSWQNASINLGPSFNNQSGTVEYRIYVWDGGQNNTLRYGYLDNVVLNGSVTPVPEPINVALGVFGFCAVVVGVGRRVYARARS